MSIIDDRYKAALIEEHDSYKRSGRTEDAEEVARVLREQYDYDVNQRDDSSETSSPALERADADRAPEAAVEPKPTRMTARRAAPQAK